MLAVAPLLLEAVRAIDGPVAARHERHARDAAARRALRLMHRPWGRAVVAAVTLVGIVATHAAAAAAATRRPPRRAALGAARRLVGEPFLRVELLLAGGKQETGPTFPAGQWPIAERHHAPLL